ncbi:MAG: hypothetical protein GX345_00045 [Clostridiales bacterium]|nr:hypothetical protein [Clostridiales bacterium]
MKRFFSVLLALVLMTMVFLPAGASLGDGTTAPAMQFRQDGSFKILHLTDLHKRHSNDYNDIHTVLLNRLAQTQDVDLAILTGDIAMDGPLHEVLENIDDIMTAFADCGIPVAVTFGNHDSEKGIISREDLMAVYNSYPNSISIDDGDLLPGCGTYNIPILSSKTQETAFNLWVIDSGDYDEEGHYGYVQPEQIDWYVNKSNALKAQNGGQLVPSMVFQHIIVPEIYDALIEKPFWVPTSVKRIYYDGRYYVLNPANTKAGRMDEYPCPPYYNSGQFEAIVRQGDVLAMFFGHDHSNTFVVEHRGVDLVASPKCDFVGTYGKDYGARLIEINEADTSTYSTELIRFASLFTFADLNPVKLAADGVSLDSLEFKARLLVPFFALFHKLDYFFTTTVGEIVTGVKIDYSK